MENSLQILKRATQMLAEVKNANDAKKIMDIAYAAEHYARKAKLGQEAIEYAHSIKIEAQAMLGRFLSENETAQGRRSDLIPRGNKVKKIDVLTISDLGLTPKTSMDSQFLSKVSKEEPDQYQAIRVGKKSISEVRREIKKQETIKKIKEFPSGKYRVIYADPPWKYNDTLSGNISEKYGGAEKHYPSLSISEICNLPIKDLSDTNSVLFLWVTSPLLFEVESVFKSWGFDYKTSFVWDKIKHNMGHYNSVRHEFLLICTKGSCLPDFPKLYDSVQSIERTQKHSEKPEEFRKIIDTLYPHGKRIELFSRKKVDGWDEWGS